MAIDGYFINQQIKEFKPLLENGKVRKISLYNKYQIIFDIYNKGKNNFLLFDVSPNSAHFRIIAENKNNNFISFTETLKKQLLNSTLLQISQYKKDRIIFIDFKKVDPFTGPYNIRLVFEIMGRNTNLILLNKDNIILDAFNKRFNEDKRSIIVNAKYEVFPTEKIVFNKADFNKIDSPLTLFTTYMGFSRELANYTFLKQVDPEELKPIPTIYKNKKLVFHTIDLELDGEKIVFNDTSSLLNYYYSNTLKSDDYLITTLNKELKKQKLKLNKLTIELKENKSYNNFKELADSIYSSGLNLSEKHTEFNNIPLNSKLTLNENAQMLYKKYKKLKSSLNYINEQLNLTNNLITYLNDILVNYDQLTINDQQDIRLELIDLNIIKKKKSKTKKQAKQNHFSSFTLDDAICLVGKTLKQNEFIYHKKAHKEDYWFHVKDYPGAHVILKGKANEENILFAAKKALINSPLNKQKSGEVIYTQIKNTKRVRSKIGFYLQYFKENTIKISL